MSALLELAERCEAATGADDELSAMLRCAVFAGPAAYVRQAPINGRWCIYELGFSGRERSWEPRGLSQMQRLGDFTASIDAALTLVPENMRDEIEITTLYRVARVSINMNHGPDGCPFYGSNESNSIPLAICAAALRARASMQGEG